MMKLKIRTCSLLFVCCSSWLAGGCTDESAEPASNVTPGADAAVNSQNDASSVGPRPASDAQVGQPPLPDGDLGENSEDDTFLRADSLVLAAPNVYAKPFGLEVSSTAQAQQTVNDSLVLDGDTDGFVDLSLLIRFIGAGGPQQTTGETTVGGGRCAQPYSVEQACGPDPSFPFQTPFLSYIGGETCKLEETSEMVSAPCFTTKKAPITLTLPLLGRVPLEHGQVVGSWASTAIGQGFVRGFLSTAAAAAVRLPDPVPPSFASLGIKPGTPLTDFLSTSEASAGPNEARGWWFLLRFTARPARFVSAL